MFLILASFKVANAMPTFKKQFRFYQGQVTGTRSETQTSATVGNSYKECNCCTHDILGKSQYSIWKGKSCLTDLLESSERVMKHMVSFDLFDMI